MKVRTGISSALTCISGTTSTDPIAVPRTPTGNSSTVAEGVVVGLLYAAFCVVAAWMKS